MISLDFISKNAEIKSNSMLSNKTNSKKGNNDFLKILEGQKDNLKNSTMEIKEETKVTNTLEKERSIVKENSRENKFKKAEELEENSEDEIKLMAIFQNLFSLCNLLEDMDLESIKPKESNFAAIEIEIGETLNLLEGLINSELLSEEFLVEALDKAEESIELMKLEIEKHKTLIEEDVEFPIEKGLTQLEGEVDKLKFFSEKTPKSSIKAEIEFEGNLEEDLNIIENTYVEIENTTEEDFLDNREDMDTNSFREEEVEIENREGPVSNFEIKATGMYRENNLSEIEKPQNFDTKEIIEQIVDKAKVVMDDFKQEIKLSLKPEILGDMVLKMETVKDGIATKIMVDNYKTKELIEANLYQLKEEMKENGLEIKTFEVFVGSNEDFQREKSNEFYSNKKFKKIKAKDEEVEEIRVYDNNVFQKKETIYVEGKLNLFA